MRLVTDATAARWVGERIPRIEDQRMITGHGRYIDDLDKPGMVHAAFVRSHGGPGPDHGPGRQRGPAGAGRDRGADRGRDQPAGSQLGRGPAGRPDSPAGAGRRRRPVRRRADRHRGGRVAVPGRGRRGAGQRGHRAGRAGGDPAQALAEGSPRVHPELPDNCPAWSRPRTPELDGLLENAPHVFTETFTQHRYVYVPMETRGLVAEWDRGPGSSKWSSPARACTCPGCSSPGCWASPRTTSG